MLVLLILPVMVLITSTFATVVFYLLDTARPDDKNGFVYHYQTLISAFIALVAAGIAYYSPIAMKRNERADDLRTFYNGCTSYCMEIDGLFANFGEKKKSNDALARIYTSIDTSFAFAPVDAYLSVSDRRILARLRRHIRMAETTHQDNIAARSAPAEGSFSFLARYIVNDVFTPVHEAFVCAYHFADYPDTIVNRAEMIARAENEWRVVQGISGEI